ncbi:hypothetical protein V2J09_003976, partial [Rumex salicifolius]
SSDWQTALCLCEIRRRNPEAEFSHSGTSYHLRRRRKMGYIGAHGVAALQRYKYSGVDHSYVSKYILQPFWSRFHSVTLLRFREEWRDLVRIRRRISLSIGLIFTGTYSLITLTGTMFLVGSALLGYIYSPQFDSPPPRWVHFAHGLLLFLYQTFDAVDGKQARRTNSSSPLGELFDHGCDALACAFESVAFASTSMCGRNGFWFWVIAAVPFYGAAWEHFFTNTLILPVINGPTEGLMIIYLCHFFTTFVGAEWWAQVSDKSIPFLSWVPLFNGIPTYRAVLYLMIAFGVIPTIGFNLYNVHKVVKSRKGSMLLALAMLYPFVILLGGVLIWDYLSPSDLIASYPHLVIVGTGLAFGFLVGRMILSHLCDEPKGLKTSMCMSLLYLPFAIANTLTARLNDGVPLVDEFVVLLGYCIFTVSQQWISGALYLHFATSVIHEITTALGIYCFRITRKEA